MTNQAESDEVEPPTIDQGDSPITSLRDDRLGRRAFAEALAAEILAAPARMGYVMGLTEPWGSGKTSILNMTIGLLRDEALVVQFNPWLFSGTEALISSFFEEIGKQLDRKGTKLEGIAEKLATYGHLLSPLASVVGVGGVVSAAADTLEKVSAKPSVLERRQELRSMLESLDERLVVIVDDVDRLRPEEVLDIVRLVRLVGDFPNTLYLLAFDRGRVEQCLGDGDLDRGRAYLEKIVQVTHGVPAARQPDVTGIFLNGLEQLVGKVPTGPLDAGDWQNIFTFVVRPLLGTPRHVRRLLGSLSMTMRLVGDEVALADLIGMEAVRVLRPTMFEALMSVADYLSARALVPGQGGYTAGRKPADSPIARLRSLDPDLAEDICRWLFPAARRYFENVNYGPEWELIWRRQRKVACSTVLRFYLERQLPEGVVPAAAVDEALSRLTDRARLSEFLGSFSPAELMDLIERLNPAVEDLPFDPDQVDADPARVGLPVLLDLIPRLPERGAMTVTRVGLRLLRRISYNDPRTAVIKDILQNTHRFSGRLTLLVLIGHRKHIGNELVDPYVSKELEDRLRDDLVGASAEDLAAESNLVGLAELMAETDDGRQALLKLAEDNKVMLSLFVDSIGEIHGQAMGAAAVEVTKVLGWDRLALCLGEEMLIRRTADLMTAVVDRGKTVSPAEQAALALAAKYAAGDRPETSLDRVTRIQAGSQATTADTIGGKDEADNADGVPQRPRGVDDVLGDD